MPFSIDIKKSLGDLGWDVVTKVGSITREYGVGGRELEKDLRDAQETFVRVMETRGMRLYTQPGLHNPVWTTNEDGSPMAVYAMDWEGKRKPKLGPDGEPLPHDRETSLEDSEGEVEYRIVGVFWAPRMRIEILKGKDDILAEERAKRNPKQFGYN